MINIHHLCILALLETKMVDHKNLSNDLGYHNYIESSASGNSGGIVIMWKEDNIPITSLSIFPQAIHPSVKVNFQNSSWILSIVYTSIDFNNRKILWDQLISLADSLTYMGTNSRVVGES